MAAPAADREGVLAALHRHATERGADCALTTGGDPARNVTWDELAGRVEARARDLRRAGCARVVAQAEDALAWPEVLLGALAADVDVLPLAPRVPKAALATLAERAGADALLRGASEIAPLAPSAGRAGDPGRKPGEAAIVLSTSGTTGRSKLVRRTRTAFDGIAEHVLAGAALEPGERVLVAIPLFHSYGIDVLGAAVRAGACLEIHAEFRPGRFREAMLERARVAPAVPAILDAVGARGRGAGAPVGPARGRLGRKPAPRAGRPSLHRALRHRGRPDLRRHRIRHRRLGSGGHAPGGSGLLRTPRAGGRVLDPRPGPGGSDAPAPARPRGPRRRGRADVVRGLPR